MLLGIWFRCRLLVKKLLLVVVAFDLCVIAESCGHTMMRARYIHFSSRWHRPRDWKIGASIDAWLRFRFDTIALSYTDCTSRIYTRSCVLLTLLRTSHYGVAGNNNTHASYYYCIETRVAAADFAERF